MAIQVATILGPNASLEKDTHLRKWLLKAQFQGGQSRKCVSVSRHNPTVEGLVSFQLFVQRKRCCFVPGLNSVPGPSGTRIEC